MMSLQNSTSSAEERGDVALPEQKSGVQVLLQFSFSMGNWCIYISIASFAGGGQGCFRAGGL